jgi:predicted dehydrogenase
LIDLARWFFGDFTTVKGTITTLFWDMQVEDNGFLHLETADGRIAWLHASCTEWKNLFSFELYGRNAKLHIEGLGGSYGVERLSFYKMLPGMGPPETTIWEYPGEDDSWRAEVADFIAKANHPSGSPNLATLDDGMAALRIVDRVYQNDGDNPSL